MNRPPVARAAVVIGAVIAIARPAAAHQSAVKYLDVDVRGAAVSVELRFQPGDVTRPLGLADDATPDVDQALAGAARVVPYVAAWIVVRDGAATCAPSAPVLDRAAADARFLALRWTARCPREVDRLVLDLAAFFVVDRTHEVVLHLTAPDADPYDDTIAAGDSPVSLALGEAAPASTLGWTRVGAVESVTGLAHVGVVLALVLVLVIRPRDGRASRGWEGRPAGLVTRDALAVLGAFALGQTAAAVAAAAGVVALPPWFAGAMIALTIVYVAVEDALAPAVRWRPALGVAFGLVHGVGIAAAIGPVLPPDAGPVPVLAAAVGVVLGQGVMAAAAVGTLGVLVRVVGPDRYRARFLPILAAAIAILGAIAFAGAVRAA